jgi:GT2 family glycosyltransferase
MRYDNKDYCLELYKTLNNNDRNKIAASRIIGLDGNDQSPLREISFLEELFWIRDFIPLYKKNNSYIDRYKKDNISSVNKVMGCSFMIKLNFLKEINYFDQNTFLYSEEAILSSQIKKVDGLIKFNSKIKALHAHDLTKKDNSSKRMLLMLKSRKYYLKNYSGYNFFQLILLSLSYSFLKILHKIKEKVN